MTLPLICSVVLHAVLALLVFVLPQKRSFKAVPQEIREVELVSLPKPVKKEPADSPEPAPMKKPEPAVKKVEKKKEPVKKEVKKPVDKKQIEKPSIDSEPDTTAVEQVPAVGSSDVKVDIDDFPFAYYLSLIRYRIKENWRPPMPAPGDSKALTVFVGFRVLKSGRVDQVKLEHTSGRFLFDQAAKRAITTMRQLPPLPADFAGESLTVHIEFESEY